MSAQDDQERSGYRRLGMSWPTRRESDLTYVEYFLALTPYRTRALGPGYGYLDPGFEVSMGLDLACMAS